MSRHKLGNHEVASSSSYTDHVLQMMLACLPTIKVANDTAERVVKLYSDYAGRGKTSKIDWWLCKIA